MSGTHLISPRHGAAATVRGTPGFTRVHAGLVQRLALQLHDADATGHTATADTTSGRHVTGRGLHLRHNRTLNELCASQSLQRRDINNGAHLRQRPDLLNALVELARQ